MYRSVLSAVSLFVVVTFFTIHAAAASRDDSGVPPKSELSEHMKGLKANLHDVAIALQGSDVESALSHLTEMQHLVLLAKLESPSNLAQQPEELRAEHLVQFRRHLVRVLQELAEIEIDILDGDYENAFAKIIGPLFSLREEAHAKFRESE